MNDNYNFSVGCIVRKENQVLFVRHAYGGAKGKLLNYCKSQTNGSHTIPKVCAFF